ncbi:hypothetical protein CNBD4400 [Cryptococcus deneoformans B-3501A]|nr:hypothetical protein CNBD4400 [Cryptococcus neoformans var. neoformans B-3501A]EAL21064.1 hypothetical protein CNBD4400 [Cryptococcus neoformans var. neoformans B-3501A]
MPQCLNPASLQLVPDSRYRRAPRLGFISGESIFCSNKCFFGLDESKRICPVTVVCPTMFGLKKKLSAIIPSEARAHLQNILTVEWEDGNKTVLVDVPDADHPSEVEMSGMGGTYGRLADDDEDDISSRPAQRTRKSFHKSSSYTTKSKTLPRIPQQPNLARPNTNPFGGDCQPSPQTPCNSTHTASPYSLTSPQFTSSTFIHPDTYGQNSSYDQGQSSKGKEGNSRTARRMDNADDLLSGGDFSGIDFPASSSRTRDPGSSVQRGTNPFR